MLTNDNLNKRGWNGDPKCVVCGANETTDHLFMRWFVSKFLWSVLQCSFGINSAPIDVKSLFNTWLSPFDKGRHMQLCVGIY